MNILIVDDEPLLLRALDRILKARGHTVVTAKSFSEGKQLFARGFDILITDYHLDHGHTGAEMAKLVMEIGMPFLVMSGHKHLITEKWIFDAAAAVLDKPWELPLLDAAIDKIKQRP